MFVAYIGKTLATQGKEGENIEKQINILKGAQLLKQIGGQAITKAVILRTLEKLNQMCEDKLGKLASVVSLQAGDYKKSKFSVRPHYCEDPRLSFGVKGSPYLALAVDRAQTPPLTLQTLQMWIDFCASLMDLDAYVPNGKAETRTLNDMKRSQGKSTCDKILRSSL